MSVCSALRTTSISVATLFLAGSAFAAQNVANTSQKGSLLIWPLITVDQYLPGGSRTNTVIEISNDANLKVHVECMYVNERKGRVNFDFNLTPKQTVSWDVYNLNGDGVHPPHFPTNAGAPDYPDGNAYRGELVCFATDTGRTFQIAHNHLTGTAVVITSGSGSQCAEACESTSTGINGKFKYNAWAFAARNASGVAPNNQSKSQGTPGRLDLTGFNAAGAYDACPAYNIANFMPSGARLGDLGIAANGLAVVSCNQDLRESYYIHTTKLDFTVWNAREHSYTGAHACVDSVNTVVLSSEEPRLTQGSNFEYDVLRTPNARFQVKGVTASPPCPPGTEVSGLLGVLGSVTSDWQTVGNTLHGAGVLPGYVLWDPSDEVPTIRR
jgi:hypothetical protein